MASLVFMVKLKGPRACADARATTTKLTALLCFTRTI
jgi:hypothetical protein